MDSEGEDAWEKEPAHQMAVVPFKIICKVRNEVFRNTFVLEEKRFDEEYGEFKLPRTDRRHAEQTVPVTADLRDDGEADVKDFALAYKLADPVDAAILLNSAEIDVVLQCLESLIAFTENRLGHYNNDFAEEIETDPTGTVKRKQKNNNDQEEGDSYIRATLVRFPGFLNRVIELTGSCHTSVRRRAVVLFGSLSEYEEIIEMLEHTDWLLLMRNLIQAETEPIVLDWITLALKNLSKICTSHSELIRSGLLERLLDLILFDNQDPDVVQNIVEVLCNLCADPPIRKYLALKGGLEAACELSLSEFPSTQYYALCLIKGLLSTPAAGVIERFHEADGMSTIITLLNTEELKYLHPSTLEILEILLGVPVIAHELSKKKIYEFLLDQALSKTYQGQADFQAFAARCISRAASFSDQRLIMSNSNIEKKILQLLTLPSHLVRAAALEAVGSLSKTLNCRRNFRKLEIVTVLSKYLSSYDPSVREQAFFAAGTLMLYESDLADRFVKDGLLRQLQDTLTDVKLLPLYGLINNALSCVINLSETDILKEALAKFVIKQIPDLLTQADESIKIKALLCAGTFVRSDQERETFMKNGGFNAIGGLLKQSPTTDNLLRHVCWAISVLAVQQSSIVSLASTGCIKEILQAKTSSNPLTSNYASLALQRLSAIHLAFKYALQDELDPDDRIQHGFYCSEHILERNQYWSLKALMRQRNPTDPPVIVVSLPRKRFSSSEVVDRAVEQPQGAKSVGVQPKTFDAPVESGANDSSVKAVTRISTSQTRRSIGRKRGSKTTRKSREKLEEVKAEREECRPVQLDTDVLKVDVNPLCKPVIPEDLQLRQLIKQALQQARCTLAAEKKVSLLADIVANEMGGVVGPESLEKFQWRKQLSKLCEERGNCCVLLGEIKLGTFFHRAVLFKVLADRLHLPVSLCRGSLDRAWNEVRLVVDGSCEIFLVDLMFQVGRLIPAESEEARTYKEPTVHENIPRQLTHLQNQLHRSSKPINDGCPVQIDWNELDKSNNISRETRTTSTKSRDEPYCIERWCDSEDRTSCFNTTCFTGSTAKEERKFIVEDIAAARESKQKASEAQNAPEIITSKEKEKLSIVAEPKEIKRPVKLEYQVRGTQKWKSRKLIHPEQIDKDKVTQPVECAAAVRFLNMERRQSEICAVSGGAITTSKTSLSRLTASTSLGFTRGIKLKRSSELDSSEHEIRELSREDEDFIGEGFDVSYDSTDNMPYEDRLLLERWEMGLEDDVVGLESELEEGY